MAATCRTCSENLTLTQFKTQKFLNAIRSAENTMKTPTPKYKKGDKVKIDWKKSDRSGILSDMMLELQDRSISGACYDAVTKGIYEKDTVWTIDEVCTETDPDEAYYAVKIGKHRMYGLHPEHEFLPA